MSVPMDRYKEYDKLEETISAECDEEGNTLLHCAVETENEDMIGYLIAAGCDVNKKNHKGEPPLSNAIRKNNLKVTKVLLQAGASHENVYFKDLEGPLHIASQKGFSDIVQLLIKVGADVRACDDKKMTPLHAVNLCENAREDDCCTIIKALVEAGADVNAKNCFGFTPLTFAINRFSRTKGFDLLLSLRADVDVVGFFAVNILYDTVMFNETYKCKRLINIGANLNVLDSVGNNLLHIAFVKSNVEIAEFLLDNGFEINKINNAGRNPLCQGIWEWLDNMPHDPSENDDHDEHYQTVRPQFTDQIKIINLAIKRGININHASYNGFTALYSVLDDYYYHSIFVSILLKNGATFDFQLEIVEKVIRNTSGSKFPFLLLRHAALFEAQDRRDGPANFNINKLNTKSQKDYARCRDELERMKSTKVNDTNVSFFDLLTKRDISAYTRNESIVSSFEEQYVSKTFPIYYDLMSDRFTEAVECKNLEDKATNGLSYVLNFDRNLTHLILSNIIRYLDEKDLRNLALIYTALHE